MKIPKILFVAFTVFFSSIGFCEKTDFKNLVEISGFFYKKDTGELFTGEVEMKSMFGVETGNILDGKKDDKWSLFYDNGELWGEEFFKNGEKTQLILNMTSRRTRRFKD